MRALILIGVVACGGQPAQPEPRVIVVGTPATGHATIPLATTSAMTPAPHTCPAGFPVLCPDGCCAAGDTCGTAGGCVATTTDAACPADAPVACTMATTAAIAHDASLDHNDFALAAPDGFAPGKFGTGVSTNQSGCHTPAIAMATTGTGLPSGNAAETIELWVSIPPPTTTGLVGIFAEGDRAIDASLDPSDPAHAKLAIAGTNLTVTTGAWHFVAMTWAPGSPQNQLGITLDGTALGPFPTTSAYSTDPTAGIALGLDALQAPCALFPGVIDELRLEDIALDPAQLAADYTAGELALDAHAIGLWHFDEGEALRCCPTGTTCDATRGCVDVGYAPPCGTGTLCGTTCCASGETCDGGTCRAITVSITCPADLPAQCGPAGPCCPTDFTCIAGSSCECVGASCKAATLGPQGVSCGTADAFCDNGDACSTAECCATSTPSACGSACCADGDACVDGACSCPADHPTACGTTCCDAEDTCVAGACTASCGGAPVCGAFCCTGGCAGETCGCPSDHPVGCGDACCLAGATCIDNADCTCPADRTACGDDCCAPGESCQDGTCMAQ